MAEERRGSRDSVALVYGLPTSGILFAMKPRVYVETSVIGYLASRPARDLIVAAHQELTREWWEGRPGRVAVPPGGARGHRDPGVERRSRLHRRASGRQRSHPAGGRRGMRFTSPSPPSTASTLIAGAWPRDAPRRAPRTASPREPTRRPAADARADDAGCSADPYLVAVAGVNPPCGFRSRPASQGAARSMPGVQLRPRAPSRKCSSFSRASARAGRMIGSATR